MVIKRRFLAHLNSQRPSPGRESVFSSIPLPTTAASRFLSTPFPYPRRIFDWVLHIQIHNVGRITDVGLNGSERCVKAAALSSTAHLDSRPRWTHNRSDGEVSCKLTGTSPLQSSRHTSSPPTASPPLPSPPRQRTTPHRSSPTVLRHRCSSLNGRKSPWQARKAQKARSNMSCTSQ